MMDSVSTSLNSMTTPGQRPVAIAAQSLSFSYPDQPGVLCGLDLAVHEGERLGIIGHNGCGKTTLFMLLCGVLTPSTGEIALFGEPLKPGQFRPEVGLLFQDPDDQLFSASVRDDIAFGPQNMGLDPAEVEARVAQAAEMTGITPLLPRLPHHLSGGEKQMVAIAGLLAMTPKILLCDEPTASLDLRTRRRLIRFLKNSTETLLISSHDLEFVLEVCDRVLLIDEGRIIADGCPRVVMGDQALMEKHGLEKPHSLIPHQDAHHG
ncbi:ECF-type Co2+/Ni2+ uptake system ATPase comnponent NikO [Leptolyngbya sp. BL0902]|uniref:energy-coupling factor ABC transporter ATP-binding protein n=1 Tax=Leptolyngbya sp. BL0902 TaxID=1115757 RepID=UPI0018E7677E|nr:ABC transporter ATP-binding protein [Leptolyngbya sp. BL0902]QQE66997.1 ECF-type Co2+/Ni2+ uptake system ATPase comnponent NikO [Leptolyngbya sp. BL0902]